MGRFEKRARFPRSPTEHASVRKESGSWLPQLVPARSGPNIAVGERNRFRPTGTTFECYANGFSPTTLSFRNSVSTAIANGRRGVWYGWRFAGRGAKVAM